MTKKHLKQLKDKQNLFKHCKEYNHSIYIDNKTGLVDSFLTCGKKNKKSKGVKNEDTKNL